MCVLATLGGGRGGVLAVVLPYVTANLHPLSHTAQCSLVTWVNTHTSIFPSISILLRPQASREVHAEFVSVKRRSGDAQWHYCDVPGVSHDESRQASPFHCSNQSTAYFGPADNTTTGFGDVFSCIKSCVRRDADDLSLTGMRPCNNKNNVSKDIRTTCFRSVTGPSVQKNGQYSSGPSQNYYILLHFAQQQTDISSNLYPGSALWFHVTNHHIKRSHFRRNTLPSTYWFQIKRQYFHSSISVRLFRVSQPHKHSHPPRKVHRYAHTHTSSFLPGH